MTRLFDARLWVVTLALLGSLGWAADKDLYVNPRPFGPESATFPANCAIDPEGTAGTFELVDVRPTAGPFVDEVITHTQTTDASDYVQAADGEVRVRVDAFDPGSVLNANWELRLDTYSVTVSQ